MVELKGAGRTAQTPSGRELQFFNVIRRLCLVLDLPQYQSAAVDLYNRQRGDIKRYTEPTAAALIYLVAKVHRPQLLLADVCDKLRLPLNKANALVQRLKQKSLDRNAVSVPDFPIYNIKDQVEFVYSRLINILDNMFWTAQGQTMTNETRLEVRQLTLRILKVVTESGMELGRHSRPMVAAAMVVATRCLVKHRGRMSGENWERLAIELKYEQSTLIRRYREIVNVFINRARLIPWAASDKSFDRYVTHTKVGSQGITYEQIIQLTGEHMDTLLEWKQRLNGNQPSIEQYPPAFVREHRKTEARTQLVSTVQAMIREGDNGLPDNADMEMRVIYILLKKGVSADEVCLLDESQLLLRFIQLQQPRHFGHDLDQPELCDRDLSEEEARAYLL